MNEQKSQGDTSNRPRTQAASDHPAAVEYANQIIKNPYVATSTGAVMYRYLIAGKIQFKCICRHAGPQDAKLIAKLLNTHYS